MHGGRKWGWKYPDEIRIAAFALIFLLLISPSAYAHRVYVFAWIEGEMVHTESYLGGKKRAADGKIQVFDLSGARLVEGKTNEKGEFSFQVPKREDLRIVLEAGMGHRAEYLLRVSEGETPVGSPAKAQRVHQATPQSPSVQIDRAEIRGVVEEVLDAKMDPVLKELAHMRKERGPGIREIMAGIGYIVGIMGLVLYFRSRKGQKPPKDQG